MKKILIVVLVLTVLAVGGWGGRKLYRKANERRLVAEARQCLEKRDFRNAGLCLQRALQINPVNAEANRLTADMLDLAGSAAALMWRIRSAQLETNNVDARLAWAQTALRVGERNSAVQALSGIEEKSRGTAAFHKLAGACAWGVNDAATAQGHYREALRMEPTNQATVLNLAVIDLASTNKTQIEAARRALEGITKDSPLRPLSLRYLSADAQSRKAWPQALAYSQELIAHTNSTHGDKITRLQLLREAKAPEFQAWRARLEEDARKSPEHAFDLARWMVMTEGPTNTFRWLETLPQSVRTNQPLPLIISDCQIALKDWAGLGALVAKQNWGDVEFYRLALESLSRRSLDESAAAKAAWQRALRIATPRMDHLTRLAQVTAAWRWKAEMTETLQAIVTKYPKEKWAFDQLIEAHYAEGNTRAIGDLLAKRFSEEPSDNRLKNNLASISLLRKSNLPDAHRLAREAFDSSPENPFYISTYAYSLLLQNKPDEALKALAALKEDYLKIPAIAAYYGVVQAQTGHREIARQPLNIADAARMLPEEKEMVRLAKSQM